MASHNPQAAINEAGGKPLTDAERSTGSAVALEVEVHVAKKVKMNEMM